MTRQHRLRISDPRVYVRLVVRRIGAAFLTVLGISILVWTLVPMAEGDTAERVLKARGVENPSPLEIRVVREEFGLDKPLVAQYLLWLGRALRGDLSLSYQSKRPVVYEIGQRLPATFMLAAIALLTAFLSSLIAAILSVTFDERLPDHVVQLFTQASSAVPSFLLGLLILQFVVVDFGVGRVLSDVSLSGAILPAVCLASAHFGGWTQILRTNLLEALNSRYVLVARARGASRQRILWRYALPNALLPFLTLVGVGVGSMLGGAAIVETLFSWNGIGSYAVQAIAARDLPVVQGFVITATIAYILSNLITDVIALKLDPRLVARAVTESPI